MNTPEGPMGRRPILTPMRASEKVKLIPGGGGAKSTWGGAQYPLTNTTTPFLFS